MYIIPLKILNIICILISNHEYMHTYVCVYVYIHTVARPIGTNQVGAQYEFQYSFNFPILANYVVYFLRNEYSNLQIFFVRISSIFEYSNLLCISSIFEYLNIPQIIKYPFEPYKDSPFQVVCSMATSCIIITLMMER